MNAYLYLEDGSLFEGISYGTTLPAEGEVVFSTGMTGYPQSLTDPSFAGQLLVFTYPLLGNYGVPKPLTFTQDIMSNFESHKIWATGVIMADISEHASHGDSSSTFARWLEKQKVPAISGVDTRALTQHLREKGVMRGKILPRKTAHLRWQKDVPFYVGLASIKGVETYIPETATGKQIALIDCGVKHGILRALLNRGYTVHRVPWDMNPLSLDTKFDGVVVSNGPGDPKHCTETVRSVQEVLKKGVPYLGICLGHQILALAIGADTYKLRYGHRGLNQPCQDLETKRAYLTSQNHGYAVDKETIPAGYEEWFVNLNDQTNEGLRSTHDMVRSVQFHPEGCPGPFDTDWIFNSL